MAGNEDTHARVKDVFLKAADMPLSEREAFVREACGDDAEVRREVETLLAHHDPDSIVETSTSDPARRNLRPSSLSPTPPTGGFRGRRLLAALVAAALLLGLGWWTQRRLEETLLRVQGAELQVVLDTAVLALQTWIEQDRAQLELMARDPRLPPLVSELLEIEQAGSPEALRTSPAVAELVAILGPFWTDLSLIGGAIVSPQGLVLMTESGGDGVTRATAEGMRWVHATLEGGTVFVPPVRSRDVQSGPPGEADARYAFNLTTIRDPAGEPLALLDLVHAAHGEFSRPFEVPQPGETGETYAFDNHGLMLSTSRFTEELRAVGLVPPRSGPSEAVDRGAQLHVQVRDPGGDLLAGHEPTLELAARPLTRLAALAIAARGKDAEEERKGVVLEPYRNYRGVEVIGAWRWLDEYDFAVATEIERAEALAPLDHLDIPLAVLFSLLVAFVGAALYSSLSVLRLRRRLRRLHRLGQYTLLEPLGEGGMGEVHLAEHALLKRPTAIKVLPGDGLSNQGIRRFEREVRLASQLTHPNTVEIYDYGQTPDGVFYYAMEYVDGPTLADLVSRWGPVPPARAVHILKQVCESLGEAHRMGLIHRDVKPLNIMLCSRGGRDDVVKVLDFGLVKKVVNPTTREVRIGGTLLYMAPERLKSPDRVDARSDVYALGGVAYLLLSGRPIFEYEEEVDLLWKVVNAEPERLSEAAERAIPTELERLVMDCLAKDPKARPQGVSEVVARLQAIPGMAPWTQSDAARWWQANLRSGEPVVEAVTDSAEAAAN